MNQVLIPPLSRAPRGAPGARLHRAAGETMGTTWAFSFVDAGVDPAAVAQAVRTSLDTVVAQMSAWRPDSDLNRFNAAPAGAWVELPEALLTVLDAALDVARLTDGAFDPTCGALTDLWGFGPSPFRGEPPSPDAVAEARATCGWRRLQRDGRRLRQPGGLQLDLNAIAKGFAVDESVAAAAALGVAACLAEVGGELKGAGVKPDGQPWWVELESPPGQAPAARTVVALTDLAIATSGDHRRAFVHAGRTYGHTLDMAAAAPRGAGRAQAATVLHASCMWADALATSLLALAPGHALALLETQGAAGRLAWSDGRRLSSSAYDAMLGSP